MTDKKKTAKEGSGHAEQAAPSQRNAQGSQHQKVRQPEGWSPPRLQLAAIGLFVALPQKFSHRRGGFSDSDSAF